MAYFTLKVRKVSHLLEQIGSQHQHVRVLVERLNGAQIPYALEMNLGRRHDLYDVKGSPVHVISQHIKLQKDCHARSWLQ